ncbi:Aromatic/aminoadipate aminotransferase 1 [Diatrype stigma]|uniref:aromatic-amino-acid transaminase n=1 Tax=Diatrype stigma TaxID=117547 RepID=A0AAN9UBP0_9PEZI
MARLSPHKTLSSLSLISQPRHLIRSSGNGAAQAFSSSCRRPDPDMKDAAIGEQPVEPLTIADIEARRAKAGKLVAPTASYSDSDMFKSPQAFKGPKARRWDHLLTEESKSRQPCMLKQAAKHLKKPGLISLGGGLPSPENFPIERMSFTVPKQLMAAHGSGGKGLPSECVDVEVRKDDVAADRNGGVHDLSIALNYGQAIGQAQLLRWVTEHTELVRAAPRYADWRCALTIGSTGALEQALRMFCDRARGDTLLTEEFSFATALETAAPLGIPVFGIRMDEEGLLPDCLDELLEGWDPAARGGARKPHVLYTVPSGQNPTGATQGAQRRRDIYAVCQKHDVFILEDEPYYFLQMPPYEPPAEEAVGEDGEPLSSDLQHQSIDEFLGGLVPSMLSMDVDGRVMRMDSFSKVVTPGSRVGWITASEQIVERYIRHAEVASQGPSGISQLILYKLVDETWGHEGYLQWLKQLRTEYTNRRNTLLAACDKYLPRHLISWVPPAAGMFLWLKVNHKMHPEAGTKSINEIEEEIYNSCIEKGVLACPGSWFKTEQDQPLTGLYFRTTFAAASEENMAKAIERFGAAVMDSFGNKVERS